MFASFAALTRILVFRAQDILVAVVGVTGSGKSSFISLLSDEEIMIGHGQQSCTMHVGMYYFMLGGRRIWLIDTPGFDDTNRPDSEVLKDISFYLTKAYTTEVRLAGIIYLHRITDVRMQGSALKNLRMFEKLCGEGNFKAVILATTHWTHQQGKSVPDSVGEERVRELENTPKFWGGMIGLGSRVVKHDGKKTSAMKIVSDLVDRHDPVTLTIQKQLVDEKMDLLSTDAGQALQREWVEDRKRSEAKLAQLQAELEVARREKDEKLQKHIEEDTARLMAKIRQGEEETKELRVSLEKIVQEKDAQLQAMKMKWASDREKWEDKVQEVKQGTALTRVLAETPVMNGTIPATDKERQRKARAEELERFERRQLQLLQSWDPVVGRTRK